LARALSASGLSVFLPEEVGNLFYLNSFATDDEAAAMVVSLGETASD